MSHDATNPLDLRKRVSVWLLSELERWTLSLVPRGAIRRRVLKRLDRAFEQLRLETYGNPATPGLVRRGPADRR